jgi:hypothetical protein
MSMLSRRCIEFEGLGQLCLNTLGPSEVVQVHHRLHPLRPLRHLAAVSHSRKPKPEPNTSRAASREGGRGRRR